MLINTICTLSPWGPLIQEFRTSKNCNQMTQSLGDIKSTNNHLIFQAQHIYMLLTVEINSIYNFSV